MQVTFKGAPEKLATVIQERAAALLKAMEREFSGLTVEISNGKSTRKTKGSGAGKDGQLAGSAGQGTAGRSQLRQAEIG